MNCHTQTVRPLKTEVMRYGEYSKAGEFAYDRPFLWGSKRTGPDLARIGLRWPVAKLHYAHFEDPRSFAAKSNMPSYGWLKEYALKPASVQKHMDALGLTYNDEDINALDGKNELDALVAYMLWLGHAVKPDAAAASGLGAGAALFLDNCSGCHGAEGEGGFAPSLQDDVWLGKQGDISDERLIEIFTKGTDNGMPPYESAFTDGQVQDIVGHLRSLGMGAKQEKPTKGAEVFASNCAGCHKPDGTGGFGPNLTDNVWLGTEGDVSDERLIEIISKGTGKGMPPFAGAIPDEDISALVEHIRSIGAGGAPEASAAPEPDVPDVPEAPKVIKVPKVTEVPKVSGADIFAKKCAGCHKPDGTGGFGPNLTDNVWLGTEGDVPDERIIEIISKGTGKGMPSFAGAIPDEGISALVGHIRSIGTGGASEAAMPKVSGASVFAKKCAGCHKPDASGGFGPSLLDNVWFGKEGDITKDRLQEIVTKGTGRGMPPFGEVLDHDEMDAVVAFIMSL